MTKARVKLLTGIVGIVTAVALVGGGTMAWFTDKKEVEGSRFTAGTVEIQAGQSVVEDTDKSGKPLYYKEIDLDPASITATQGKKSNGGKVDTDRSKTENVLHPDKKMFSLGYGDQSTTGVLTAKFTEPLNTGDVLVIENTWGNSASNYVETAEVYVSDDNNDWTYAGMISNQTEKQGDYHKSIVSNPTDTARYVKLVDTTPKTLPKGGDNQSDDGFDIDYICGRNIIDEANWNPGSTNKLAFYVTNSGTKDIDVRVELKGHWETLQGGEWKENDDLADPDMISISNSEGWTKDGDFYYCSSNDEGGLKGTYGGESQNATDTFAVLDLTVQLSEDAGNEYQNAKYVITPTFQAIQHSHQGGSDGWNWDNFEDYDSIPKP